MPTPQCYFHKQVLRSYCIRLMPVGYVPVDGTEAKADPVPTLAAACWRPWGHGERQVVGVLPLLLVAQSCLPLCDLMGCNLPCRLLCPWDSPGKNTGVGCHFLLQGIFLIQGLNLHLLHGASQMVLVVKNLPASAGDKR